MGCKIARRNTTLRSLQSLLVLSGWTLLWTLLTPDHADHVGLQRLVSFRQPQAKTLPDSTSKNVLGTVTRTGLPFGSPNFTAKFWIPSLGLSKRALSDDFDSDDEPQRFPEDFNDLICKGEKYYTEGITPAFAGNGPPAPPGGEDDLANGWGQIEPQTARIPQSWREVLETTPAGYPEEDDIYQIFLENHKPFRNKFGAQIE
ncbi:MAG: hypothetical protein Q9183_006616, partial [Haloplaca sp. 2 TL-2023]